MGGRFKVNPPELAELLREMGRFDNDVDTVLVEMDRVIADLHMHWDGETAHAQHEAHDRWMQGAQRMREALAELRKGGQRGHDAYTAVNELNTGMAP